MIYVMQIKVNRFDHRKLKLKTPLFQFQNLAFEGDSHSQCSDTKNGVYTHNVLNSIHLSIPGLDPDTKVIGSSYPPPHYSTLGHPQRHLLKAEKICNSAPCTLDKRSLKERQNQLHSLNNNNDDRAYIITEPSLNNNSIVIKSSVLPSPSLRAHELAMLANPLKITLQTRIGKGSPTSRLHVDHKPPSWIHRKCSNRGLLILSISLGVCAVVLVIIIFVIWQVGKCKEWRLIDKR